MVLENVVELFAPIPSLLFWRGSIAPGLSSRSIMHPGLNVSEFELRDEFRGWLPNPPSAQKCEPAARLEHLSRKMAVG
jgi:hypothetical protein